MKSIKKLNIAIVHDIFGQYGGSENVAIELARIFPNADIYTTWFDHHNPAYHLLQKRIKSSFPVFHPYSLFRNKNYLKPIIQAYWEKLDFSSYDLVFSSSHSYSSKAIITPPQVRHICYCHTPPKYLYTEYSESNIKNSRFFLTQIALSLLRQSDYVAAQRPDIFVTNSKTVQSRIQKYYRRNSFIVYPPVNVPKKYQPTHNKEDYYIYLGRLSKGKNISLAIHACNALRRRLIVAGDGPERHCLQTIAGPTIQFTGGVNETMKQKLLTNARGCIFPCIDEDFGIVPVEAMAYGTPVIALYSGGVTETVIEGRTGIFYYRDSVDSLVDAIKKFEIMHFHPRMCYKQAKKFSSELFKKNILSLLSKIYEANTAF